MQATRFYSFITLSLALILLFGCRASNNSENETPAAPSPDAAAVSDLIKQADALYGQRDDLEKVRAGINLLKRARDGDPNNFEANWKLARLDFYLGDSSTDDKEGNKAFKGGIDAGRAASRIAPDKPDGYFWTGANLGGRADKNPLTEGLTSIGEIRRMMNKTIEIQPGYQSASAFDVLAQIELDTRATGGGSAEKAQEYLEKAVTLAPDNANVRLHLAQTYLAIKRPSDAKKQLEYAVKIKPDPENLPENKDAVDDAKKMLETKF